MALKNNSFGEFSDTNEIPEDFQATDLGVLPEKWDIVKLADVIQKTSTLNPNRNPNYEFDYIDVSSVSSDTLTIVNTTHCIAHSCPSRARKIVEENDVIFATVRPSLRRISQVPKNMNNRICSTAFCVLRSNPNKIDPSFLFYAVSYGDFVDRVSEHQRGVAYPAITDKEILEELIPLPPLPEQHAIAHVLRTVREAKEKTDAVIAATKALKASMMKYLFTYGPVPLEDAGEVALKETEIGTVPERWKILKLGELCQNEKHAIQTGPFGSQLHSSDYVESGIPVVMPRDITYNGISTEKIAHIDISDYNRLKRHSLKINDIVLGRRGEIGRRAIIQKDQEGWICGTGCLRIRILNDQVLPDFLNIFFSTPQIIEWLSNEAIGTTMQNLSSSILKSTPIVIPSIEEQKKIIDLFNAIDQKLAAEQSRKEALDTLFASLLRDLMTAKIRVSGTGPAPEKTS
jgi:type I restriction enzyme, S subunit